MFSPDGTRLATGSGRDHSIRIWDSIGRQIAQFEGVKALSPDWQEIAVASELPPSDDQVVRIYRIDTNLDSLLSRVCQILNDGLLDSPDRKVDRDRCIAQTNTNPANQRATK